MCTLFKAFKWIVGEKSRRGLQRVQAFLDAGILFLRFSASSKMSPTTEFAPGGRFADCAYIPLFHTELESKYVALARAFAFPIK